VGQCRAETALAPPSPEAKRQLSCKSIDLESGEMQSSRGKAVSECLRLDAKGRIIDTQYRLVSRENAHSKREREAGPTRAKRDDLRCSRQLRAPLLLPGLVTRSLARGAAVGLALGLWPAGSRANKGTGGAPDPNSFWNHQR
jgi:hypothetical protein